MKTYRELLAWQRCHSATIAVYRATDSWPLEERYGLTSQLRRAMVSSAANIAEGTAKRGAPEWRRYLDIARGSLTEAEYLLELARDLDYLDQEEWAALEAARAEGAKPTWLLYRSLQK